jgi:hypothetical protein
MNPEISPKNHDKKLTILIVFVYILVSSVSLYRTSKYSRGIPKVASNEETGSQREGKDITK